MSNTESGKLIVIGHIQTFSSGFTKREIVIDTGGEYPQQIAFELIKDKTSAVDGYQIGTPLTVHYNLRGNEYNGRYYTNLQAWRLEPDAGGSQQPQQQYNPTNTQDKPVAPSLQTNEPNQNDDIPF